MTELPSQTLAPPQNYIDINAFDPDMFDKGKLFALEAEIWRNRARWLEERGYVLRPRYQPTWIASWLLDNTYSWVSHEDEAGRFGGGPVLDAIRISDGARVLIKRISPSKYPREIPIGEMFSSNPLSSDPHNHCIPIIETLYIPDEDDAAFLVMPFLTTYLDPKFGTVGELLEMFCQLFEGIHFMHINNIAHCDSKENNFMMDGLPLYSSSPHPGNNSRNFEYTSGVTTTSRTLRPVNYYVIDFGLSGRFADDVPPEHRRVRTEFGGDKTVPEFKDNVLCDPFKVDVYCLGNFIRETFLEGEKPRRNLGFIKPLIDSMVKDDPSKRPTMSEAVQELNSIRARLSWWQLRAPVSNGILLLRPFRATRHWSNQIGLMRRGVPSIPTP